MERKNFFSTLIVALSFITVSAQDIPQSQVPAVVINSFQQKFPKAADMDWELKGDLYEVEFETGLLGTDHEAWFNKTGKMIKHKEDVSKRDLPKTVTAKLNQDFPGYRIDDVKKITEGQKVTYTLEAKKGLDEWKIAIDIQGKVLSKIAD